MTAFYWTQEAIEKVQGDKAFRWKQLETEIVDAPPKSSDTEAVKLITFNVIHHCV
jgi:hypothetical protein